MSEVEERIEQFMNISLKRDILARRHPRADILQQVRLSYEAKTKALTEHKISTKE